jgi:hypothetical protein
MNGAVVARDLGAYYVADLHMSPFYVLTCLSFIHYHSFRYGQRSSRMNLPFSMLGTINIDIVTGHTPWTIIANRFKVTV